MTRTFTVQIKHGVCSFCEEAFTYEFKTGPDRRFCSRDCGQWYNNTMNTHGNLVEARRRRASHNTQKPCAVCDALFTVPPGRTQKIYCSDKCRSTVARLHAYGGTLQEYRNKLAASDGKCEMCGVQPAVHLDHDHTAVRMRGFLCMGCNFALGWYEANKDKLYRYLDRHGNKQA